MELMILSFFSFLLAAVYAAQIPLKSPEEKRGVILLDDFTFPKLIPSSTLNWVILVANKRSIGDYGTDSIREDFFSFSEFVQTKDEEGKADNLVFAQIIVNGAQNAKLAERIGVEKDFKHPKMFLYVAGNDKPIPYPENSPFHLQSLIRFLQQNTAYSFRIPGTLTGYDELVKSVAHYVYGDATETTEGDEGVDTPSEAEEVVKTFTEDATFLKFIEDAKQIHATYEVNSTPLPIQHVDADLPPKKSESLTEKDLSGYYLKVLDAIAKSGIGYVKKEIERLRQIIDNKKLTPVTRTKLLYQLNVLKTFLDSKANLTKEEVLKIKNLPNRHADL